MTIFTRQGVILPSCVHEAMNTMRPGKVLCGSIYTAFIYNQGHRKKDEFEGDYLLKIGQVKDQRNK